MSVKFTNNAETTLASGINSSVTSLTVASSTGFPTITTGEYFYVTLDDGTNNEIVKVTAVSGNTWTIVRAQDNTTARSFSSSNKVELRVTAGLITDAVTDALASSFAKNAFTGDGTETNFTLSQSPNSEDDLIVFIEGVFQNQSTYSLSGTTLTFSTAPADTRAIVVYTVKAAVSGANLNHDQFTASGSAAFTLSIAPINENNTQVFIDGVYQQKTDYVVSGTTLTFDTAPASGAIVEVMTFTQTEVNVPATGSVVAASIVNDVNLNGNPTTTTQSAGNNTTRIATTSFVETALSNLIDSAPNTMNTLNEIAAALGDDPTFTTTVNNAIALKAPLASPTFTGDAVFDTTTLKVDATNNRVGIGTASPNYKLEINHTGADTYALVLNDEDTVSNATGLYLRSTSEGRISFGSGAALTFAGAGGGSERMRIDSSGKVGIGTASPANLLHVTSSGSTPFATQRDVNSGGFAMLQGKMGDSASTTAGHVYTALVAGIEDNTNGAEDGYFAVEVSEGGSGSEKLRIKSDGNVGIGTTSPDTELTIVGGIKVSQSALTDSITMSVNTSSSYAQTITLDDVGLTFDNNSGSRGYRFGNNGSERMRIDNSGNVGIGTTSPSSYESTARQLVVGSGSGSNGITIASASDGLSRLFFADGTSGGQKYDSFIAANHGASALLFGTGATGTEDMRIDSSGRLLIGQTINSDGAAVQIDANSSGSTVYSLRVENSNTATDVYNGIRLIQGASGSAVGVMATGGSTTGNASYRNVFHVGTQNATSLVLGTNDTERMRINSSGNVGIGTTSPSNKLGIKVTSANSNERLLNLYTSSTTAGAYVSIGAQYSETNALSNSEIRFGNEVLNNAPSFLAFATGDTSSPAERMRIESTGDIRFNIANAAITAGEVHTFTNAGRGNNLGLYTTGADQHFSIDMWNHTGGSCNQVQFRGGANGAVTGTITSTGNNATQYNTSSDYRLKENVAYTWDATSRLKQLKPVRFNWIDDDTNTLEDGFLAHEVSSVVPNAVRGEKDAVYTEEEAFDDMHINAGDVKRQQLDHSKLVPLLVKTIQELEARIKTLEES